MLACKLLLAELVPIASCHATFILAIYGSPPRLGAHNGAGAPRRQVGQHREMSERQEFDRAEVEDLLVRCHRRCCVCHRHCGVKAEVDHIDPARERDSGRIDNAIVLCFDCHAEVHHYNDQHPRGRKFRPSELRAHRDQWLSICALQPEIFVRAMPPPEAGSLERLLSELEFNYFAVSQGNLGVALELAQFRRAIADGTFIWIEDALKKALFAAYEVVNEANRRGEALPLIRQTQERVAAQQQYRVFIAEKAGRIRRCIELLSETRSQTPT